MDLIFLLQAILQSKVTVLLLTSLSVLTAAKQYLGDPIHCIFDARSGVKTEAIDAFCWIHATFPLDPSLIEKLSQLPGHGPPHISRLCSASQTPPPDTSFYQWVHVFLILQVKDNNKLFVIISVLISSRLSRSWCRPSCGTTWRAGGWPASPWTR